MPFLSVSWISGSLLTSLVRRSLPWTLYTSANRRNFYWKIQPRATTGRMSNLKEFPKPPNVLIYTGGGSEGLEKYNNVRRVLVPLLNRDSYVTYQLDTEKVLTDPWSENTVLLVLATNETLGREVQEYLTAFLVNGGKILSLCTDFCPLSWMKPPLSHSKQEDGSPLILATKIIEPTLHGHGDILDCVSGGRYYEDVSNKDVKVIACELECNRPVLVQVTTGDQGTAYLSQVHLELDSASLKKLQPDSSATLQLQKSDGGREHLLKSLLESLGISCASSAIPCLTPLYLLCHKKSKGKFIRGLNLTTENKQFKGKDVTLEFVMEKDDIPDIKENLLPVIVDSSTLIQAQFDDETYFSNLRTRELGQVVLYTDVVTSTQQILEGIPRFIQSVPSDTGVAVVCRQQIKGKGRSGNAWLSPLGCMMFSLMVRLKVNSELGARLPFLQHIASLAVVEAVRSLSGYENINMCLKWPNDIYYGRSVKIGGVIVSSSAVGNTFNATIGMGVNVSNREPTVCINDMIKEYNREYCTCLEPLPTELLLARTVTLIEELIGEFQMNGSQAFLKRYYKRWLHSNAQVTVSADTAEVVTIKGLDEFGFLSVQRDSGEVYSVQPDGNSFDMLRNLILMKQKSS